MATTALIQAHIDEDLKLQAEKIFSEEGLTMTDVIRALLIRTVKDQSTPHDLFVPNAETLEALEEARAGNLPSFHDLQSLKAYLNADD